MYKITEEQVKSSIKSGLMAYKDVAKIVLKHGGRCKKWETMSFKDKVNAARSLVVMYHVAKNPEKFLSKNATESAWRLRAEEYAKQTNCDIFHAYVIVQGPKELVRHGAENALQQPLSSRYFYFLKSIQEYEYTDDEGLKLKYAKEIVDKSKNIQEQLDIMKLSFLKRWFKQREYDLQKTN